MGSAKLWLLDRNFFAQLVCLTSQVCFTDADEKQVTARTPKQVTV